MLNLKKTGFIFALTLSALTFNITALAYTIPDMVRVGISSFANKGSITISNSSLYVGSGADYDRYEDIGIIESAGDFTIQLPEGYYVDCMESFDTYEEAWDYVTDYDDYGRQIGFGVDNNLCVSDCSLLKKIRVNNKLYRR